MYPNSRQPSRNTLTAPIRKMRFAWVALIFAGWVVLIGGRLVWLQVIQHSEWVQRAERQQQRTFDVAPQRGVLYDRNLHQLATTVQVDSIYAVPSELGDNRAQAAQILARIVHTDPQDGFTSADRILARFNDSRNFAWVARRVDAATAERVRELNLKGVGFQKEFKRFYPDGDMAAQVLGYVGTDDNGLSGLEEEFDDEMHGEPGHMLTAVDAKRHVMSSHLESEPVPGENLVLSIDSNIQYMAERALDEQVAKMKALHGTVVVQDPHTGQILALAVSPRFNPNDARHIQPGSLQDLAVSDVYEPGSTFKLVTYATALDAAHVQPTDMVDCQGGAMTMFGRTLHDDHTDHFGVVTVQYALEHSSDVGAAKMALKVGPDTFYKYIRGFGFGQRSGIELPSETRGLLRPPSKWGSTSILSLAIGQEVGVTPVQLVTMVSTIANGGVYMPPHVLLDSADEGDAHLKPVAFQPQNELPAKLPDGAHRVITELTAAKMRSMMEGIVTEGTGRNAALNGYSAGGKTGTAQKVDPVTHTYSHTNLVASFAGFAPVSSPVVSIAVVIDNPTVGTRYGAETSAPVFREIAQQVLEYLGVPHDQPLKTQKQLADAAKPKPDEDGPSENIADLNAMFDEVNHLPADDPLRKEAESASKNGAADGAPSGVNAESAEAAPSGAPAKEDSAPPAKQPRIFAMLPKKVLAAFSAENNSDAGESTSAALHAPAVSPAIAMRGSGSVVVDAGKRIAVPSFSGDAVRNVVEKAAGLGLQVRPLGSGLARDQAPAAGTMVPAGTEVVVRFAR